MEYAIYVTLDKKMEKDYCILASNSYDENTINLNIYTSGKNKINFRELDYFTFSELHYKDFITYFSYGRNVFNNAKLIHITNTSKNEKNTKKENREIMNFINNNKELLNKKIYIDVGLVKLNDEDMDILKPLKKCKYASVTFDETCIYHYLEELEMINSLVKEVVSKTNKYDFSPIEMVLYAYDLIRTNFAGNKPYDEKMEKVLKLYTEPSYCYALIYREVLDRLKIKNKYALGEFPFDSRRAFNIAYIKDDTYNIEGIYYFDIANNSKQRFNNSLIDVGDKNLLNNLINNYESFCKTKIVMEDRGSLENDYAFGDFDEGFMDIYNFVQRNDGINGIYKLRGLINNVSYFVDGIDIIDSFKGIKDEDELEEIKENTERYAELFAKDIDGEDFLEMLFNVRAVEYIENKEVFPLSKEALKMCLYNSQFALSNMLLEFSEEREYEQEDIDEILQETFENSFDEVADNQHIDEKIRKLKLSLNKENKPNKDDNN